LFPNVKIIRNEDELFVSGSRNKGLEYARGDYIFLVDDDNILDRLCIYELVNVMENNTNIGILAPISLYLEDVDRVCNAGEVRNMWISANRVLYKDTLYNADKLPDIIECMCVGNAFMVRRKILHLVKFNENYFPFQHEDIDFCFKVRSLGYSIVCCTSAKVWHDVPVEWDNFLEKTNMLNEYKSYLVGRNRVLLQRMYSRYYELLVFVSIFLPLICMYHIFGILTSSNISLRKRLSFVREYLVGAVDGLVIR